MGGKDRSASQTESTDRQHTTVPKHTRAPVVCSAPPPGKVIYVSRPMLRLHMLSDYNTSIKFTLHILLRIGVVQLFGFIDGVGSSSRRALYRRRHWQ